MARGAVPTLVSAVAEVCVVRGGSMFIPPHANHSARLRRRGAALSPVTAAAHFECARATHLAITELGAQSVSAEWKTQVSLSLKMRLRKFHENTLDFYI